MSQESNTELSNRQKIASAKNVSKWGMLLSVMMVLGYNIGYFVIHKDVPAMEKQKSVITAALAVVTLFSPVYLSIILDKVSEFFKK